MFALLLLAVQFPTDVPSPRRGEDPHAPRGYRFFGTGLSDVGDLDGDGRDEFTVSDSWGSDPHTVWILSGADAHVVDRLSSNDCEHDFGDVVTRIPDVDLDGVDDIAVAAPASYSSCAPGQVAIYSGRTRAHLRTIVAPLGVAWFGFGLSGLTDVDGDGCGDVLATSADSSSARSGFVFSGKTGALLREVWCPATVQTRQVFPIGDVDGDGRVDLALTGTEKGTHLPIAHLSSTRDGRSLGLLRGSKANPDRGVFALRLGEHIHGEVLLLSNSVIEAFSMERVGSLWATLTPTVPYDVYEAGCGSIGDLDGDAVPDFVLANPEDWGGSVACRSGRTGTILWQEGPWPSWRNVELWHMGKQLAVIGDYDRDGVRDFIWGTDNSMNGDPGLVFISSGKTGHTLQVLARGPNLEILRLGPKE